VRTESEAEVELASYRSDQGDEAVEKSSAERRASRTRRNGCGVPPCTMHESCWVDTQSGIFAVPRQMDVQQQGVGWRARISVHHRRRHGELLESGGKQREQRRLPLVGVFRALEKGNMGCGDEERR